MRNMICVVLGLCLFGTAAGRAEEANRIKELTLDDAKRLALEKK